MPLSPKYAEFAWPISPSSVIDPGDRDAIAASGNELPLDESGAAVSGALLLHHVGQLMRDESLAQRRIGCPRTGAEDDVASHRERSRAQPRRGPGCAGIGVNADASEVVIEAALEERARGPVERPPRAEPGKRRRRAARRVVARDGGALDFHRPFRDLLAGRIEGGPSGLALSARWLDALRGPPRHRGGDPLGLLLVVVARDAARKLVRDQPADCLVPEGPPGPGLIGPPGTPRRTRCSRVGFGDVVLRGAANRLAGRRHGVAAPIAMVRVDVLS